MKKRIRSRDDFVVLGIESTCDDSGIALATKNRIIFNRRLSSIEFFKKFFGIVPLIAARYQVINLTYLLSIFLNFFNNQSEGLKKKKIVVAYADRPGLISSLLIGRVFAQVVFRELKGLALIPVDHVVSHLYASLLDSKGKIKPNSWIFPILSLVVSGGHTSLYFASNHKDFQRIGSTLDDAAGECLDKVGRALGFPYPGGPTIERHAKSAQSRVRNRLIKDSLFRKSPFDFSFSGLKSAAFRHIAQESGKLDKNEFCFSFQEEIFEIIEARLLAATKAFSPASLVFGGGVCANSFLKNRMRCLAAKLKLAFFYPPKQFSGDNAAMNAIRGYHLFSLIS